MSEIQIDMFEVQLGAAILLQFTTSNGPVRVLADGGVGRGLAADHVLKKLLPILDKSGDRRIDLMIGTHYDEDHLKGLVPIIEDPSIDIGEAWMPPVATDTLVYSVDQAVRRDDLLAIQFAGDDADVVLRNYLQAKWRDCETIRLLETPVEQVGDEKHFLSSSREPPTFDGSIEYFREQQETSTFAAGGDHGVDELVPSPEVERLVSEARHSFIPRFGYLSFGFDRQLEIAAKIRSDSPEVGRMQSLSLANIRNSAAGKAITAKSLHAVVKALTQRGIKVRSEIIDDGEPKRYRWDATRRRFILAKTDRDGLIFDLLGPSRSLVRKHRDILPVAEATKVALLFRGALKGITPSNQLSYVGRFGLAEQGILIAGDAGCVDFAETGKPYFPKLLSALLPLHIVQVAHHAGQNAHFYRVLMAAKFAEQAAPSLMLLSHAYHDKTRPSPEFEDFLLSTLHEGDDVKLLFTSLPTADKVADYLEAIHPAVGSIANVGDVQIVYKKEGWSVTRHAIRL